MLANSDEPIYVHQEMIVSDAVLHLLLYGSLEI